MLMTRSVMLKRQSSSDSHRRAGAKRSLAVLVALASFLPAAVQAKMPNDFLGKWSTDPLRCEQENGEVDVLEVLPSGLTFYEVGCEFGEPHVDGKTLRVAAQCYKGGSPMSAGTVELSRSEPNRISLSLHGFSWSSDDPETFQRCRAR
ncbi:MULTISPECIES: hypothetical protein [unclassified Mesorhizobium]|uniref:hypothetical protein n=1 Tax=unclassified Mesorhizobium TaxID=325217 RepID=UPI00112C3130|nr:MULTISPECIES: hypothetical protein [unclassified Mesorhizobium]TPJ40953.1 hypothetical protein FJ437_24985 [Mesorhizobium sp. B2-6-6]MCA0008661.1 hypothetical protein [Mesorhizobium sp. B264B1B]MCA0019461.1 hypothetical protein [Mesorhizobium sp. B264B1A]MCA0024498.1 hypothetical protein [Mesorhizobium sp. B263B1A]MCA0055830.1 hypothetical protein [Mesorhizobium sp. B261B1A]